MTTQMIIKIEPETKLKLSRFAQSEGKNTSQVVRELIYSYINDRDMGAYIDKIWESGGKKLKEKNIQPEDIGKIIKEVRASQT
ncbi:MAG: CopG family transcriptional regulator [Nitrospinae bacterium]|nr:CopG family transcriptional regulator [Nitrospinota bacterium]